MSYLLRAIVLNVRSEISMPWRHGHVLQRKKRHMMCRVTIWGTLVSRLTITFYVRTLLYVRRMEVRDEAGDWQAK